jgi:hypothetical protein
VTKDEMAKNILHLTVSVFIGVHRWFQLPKMVTSAFCILHSAFCIPIALVGVRLRESAVPTSQSV